MQTPNTQHQTMAGPRVKFDEIPIYVYIFDDEDCKMARVGPWQIYARDRAHFKRRIELTEKVISWVLSPLHRDRAHAQRAQTRDNLVYSARPSPPLPP